MGDLRGFDLDVHRLCPTAHRHVQDSELFLHAAIELAVILMAAARGQNRAIGKLIEKTGNRLGALAGVGEEIQPELQERFPSLGLTLRVFQKGGNVRQAQCDADTWERSGLRHSVVTQNNMGAHDGTKSRRR